MYRISQKSFSVQNILIQSNNQTFTFLSQITRKSEGQFYILAQREHLHHFIKYPLIVGILLDQPLSLTFNFLSFIQPTYWSLTASRFLIKSYKWEQVQSDWERSCTYVIQCSFDVCRQTPRQVGAYFPSITNTSPNVVNLSLPNYSINLSTQPSLKLPVTSS